MTPQTRFGGFFIAHERQNFYGFMILRETIRLRMDDPQRVTPPRCFSGVIPVSADMMCKLPVEPLPLSHKPSAHAWMTQPEQRPDVLVLSAAHCSGTWSSDASAVSRRSKASDTKSRCVPYALRYCTDKQYMSSTRKTTVWLSEICL